MGWSASWSINESHLWRRISILTTPPLEFSKCQIVSYSLRRWRPAENADMKRLRKKKTPTSLWLATSWECKKYYCGIGNHSASLLCLASSPHWGPSLFLWSLDGNSLSHHPIRDCWNHYWNNSIFNNDNTNSAKLYLGTRWSFNAVATVGSCVGRWLDCLASL